jgi:dTDP-4-dehydrorhamnose 3,5-epimerase
MKVTPIGIDGAWLIESPTYLDNRGLFREWFIHDLGENSVLPEFEVKQANTSISSKGVIRGIHYSSSDNGQSKIVTCTSGSILDAVVDLRVCSKTFGKSVEIEISANDGRSVYIESGLGHAFQALEDNVAVTYLLNKKYNAEMEYGINPLDGDLQINWKSIAHVVSEKDMAAKSFSSVRTSGLSK